MGETGEGPNLQEKRETLGESKRVGILLTAEARRTKRRTTEKEGVVMPPRVVPDLEGKMRMLAAVEDLRNGVIDELIITGGASTESEVTAETMLKTARGFARKGREENDELAGKIRTVSSGAETYTDLKAVFKDIGREEGVDATLVYTSPYHIDRAATFCESMGFMGVFVDTPKKVLERWKEGKRHEGVKWLDEFLKGDYMKARRKREEKTKKFLKLKDGEFSRMRQGLIVLGAMAVKKLGPVRDLFEEKVNKRETDQQET